MSEDFNFFPKTPPKKNLEEQNLFSIWQRRKKEEWMYADFQAFLRIAFFYILLLQGMDLAHPSVLVKLHRNSTRPMQNTNTCRLLTLLLLIPNAADQSPPEHWALLLDPSPFKNKTNPDKPIQHTKCPWFGWFNCHKKLKYAPHFFSFGFSFHF